MGEIIQGPWSEHNQLPSESNYAPQPVDINTLVSQLQGFVTSISSALQTAEQATVCFQRYDVLPDQCARAAAGLETLSKQVENLISVVKNAPAGLGFSVVVQANYVIELLGSTVDSIREVAQMRGTNGYEAAWRAAYQNVQDYYYPAQVRDLVQRLSACASEIIRNALS